MKNTVKVAFLLCILSAYTLCIILLRLSAANSIHPDDVFACNMSTFHHCRRALTGDYLVVRMLFILIFWLGMAMFLFSGLFVVINVNEPPSCRDAVLYTLYAMKQRGVYRDVAQCIAKEVWATRHERCWV